MRAGPPDSPNTKVERRLRADTDRAFRAIRTRFVPDAAPDPYEVLEVMPDDDLDTIRAAWRTVFALSISSPYT